MTTALHGWHDGEIIVQQKLGYRAAVAHAWRATESSMREQHRIFHTSNLHFVPLTTSDSDGRPWSSLLAGSSGEIGFITSPDSNTLLVRTRLWEGDPLLDTLHAWLDPETRRAAHAERFLIAGVGIEFSTRRRNKFAGYIRSVRQITEMDFELTLFINEALGNCPKYINVREFAPYPSAKPTIAYRSIQMEPQERLPQQVIDFIKASDTVWVGSLYKSQAATAAEYPSHAGSNARGGLPGFVRVKPSDGRTVVVPDYSGNRFLMSLGNIESSKLAALTFMCFTTGDVLYLTGKAKILVGEPAMQVMTKHACILAVETTGFSYVKNAFPVRQRPGTAVAASPYSPKIKYLVDEPEALAAAASGGQKAKLVSAVRYSDDIATFRFQVVDAKPGAKKKSLKIRPGQAVVLDFMDWIGPPAYSHMANSAPGSINDDRVRTWTVSSAHETDAKINDDDDRGSDHFEMTMREMPGGAVTGALFNILRKYPNYLPGETIAIQEDIVSEVVGVTGDFALGQGPVNMLWVAGGIGLTPFLSMLSALAARGNDAEGDVVLALSARDPVPFIKLTEASLGSTHVRVTIDLFTNQDNLDVTTLERTQNVQVRLHRGRIPNQYWAKIAGDRQVFICGPGGFGDAAVDGLRSAGVPNTRIHREGFY